MKKKLLVMTLVLLLILSTAAYAVEPRVSTIPTLTFSQSTAYCDVTVTNADSYIEVTLSLWYGNQLIDSWENSGWNHVHIEETCEVTRRRNYTLTASGTIDGIEFEESVTRTCS